MVLIASDSKAEKVLAQMGRHGEVTEAHGIVRQEMAADFRAVVERLTGQKVLAFLSANYIDPDVAAAIVRSGLSRGVRLFREQAVGVHDRCGEVDEFAVVDA
jgi:hypothetical protein